MEWQTLPYKPLYMLLADHLEDRIKSGDSPNDSFLPPVRKIMKLFNVSLATVRNALNILTERRLISRKQGSGIKVIFKSKSTDSAETALDISSDISSLFSMRRVLELDALKRSFKHINRDRLRKLARGNAEGDMVVDGVLARFAAYAGLPALQIHAGNRIDDAHITGDLGIADNRKGEVGILTFDVHAGLNVDVDAF